MSSAGAARCAAVPVSSARAGASRKNRAKSRGPKTAEGKARSAQNALKHGMRAQKYAVLPDEDAAEFAGLEAAMIKELAPIGALQTVLARRSRLPPGASRGPIASRPSCSRSGAMAPPAPASPSFGTATGRGRSRHCCATAARRWPSSGAPCAR